jgi:plasmid maintenance system antidote protein VapI
MVHQGVFESDTRLMLAMRMSPRTPLTMNNPSHPGELFGDVLAVGLDEAAQAVVGADILTVQTAISADMTVRLEKSPGRTAAAWLRLQDNCALAHSEASSLEARRLRV